eukprot:m.195625 g.195625  ORF g.195625 m.195625 type:complete len:1003 (-) comp32576_c0_seq1:270-3278(-)
MPKGFSHKTDKLQSLLGSDDIWGENEDSADVMLTTPLNEAFQEDKHDGTSSRGGSGPNPFRSLNDIVNSGKDDYDADNDTLALFQHEGKNSPKVADVLSNLVRYPMGEAPADDLTAENSMLALLQKAPVKLGTMMGVYLPTVQNILGVILFLRVPWIVGTAGIGQSLAIVFMCCLTTLLTALSMSAIATNGMVPAGGAYFMISRALGPELGGAVGILFYLGTTTAGAMYILGAVELLLAYMAQDDMSAFGHLEPGNHAMLSNLRLYGTVLLLVLAFIVFVGVKYVNRFANLCLFAVIVSIGAIFLGFFLTPLDNQPMVCMVDGALMKSDFAPNCTNEYMSERFEWFTNVSEASLVRGYPGISNSLFMDNFWPTYLIKGEKSPGVDAEEGQVYSHETTSFVLLLAIFFPSVTGIMAGSNRSGDLKDASDSIPKGTVAAITTTSVIYMLSVVFLGACIEGTVLRDKFGNSLGGKLVLSELVWPSPWIVLVGSFLSCIGAALQTLTGAPRLLQAIAKDEVLPFLKTFSKASSGGEPHRALLLTVLIAECSVMLASLDAVAPIITMFFLMCYCFVNVACALQSLLKSPSWRPRYRYYHWTLSALGAFLCVLLMLLSSWIYALLAGTLAMMIYYYIHFKGAATEWGDGLRGLSIQAARFSLLRLEEDPPHTKNWRPQLLVMVKFDEDDNVVEDAALVALAGQLKLGKGLTLVSSILSGDFVGSAARAQKAQKVTKKLLKDMHVEGFAKVIVGSDLEEAMGFCIQGSGLGALTHNTVIFGWPEKWRTSPSASLLMSTIRTAQAASLAVMIPKNFPSDVNKVFTSTIDVWWILHDGGMLLLITYLLKQVKTWSKCTLRIFCVAESDDNGIQMEQDLALFLKLLRITAEVNVVEMSSGNISARAKHCAKKMENALQSGLAFTSPSRNPEVSAEANARSDNNLRRMNTSSELNKVMKERSSKADLIAINLPAVQDDEHPLVYLSLVEEMITDLERVLLVRGGGREVITIFS